MDEFEPRDDAARIDNTALKNAERLAWLRNWSAALPYYQQAEREFTSSGDRRNALFAHISGIRGELRRLPLLETSELLANELEDPLVESDSRLRLRCLVVKGDVDLDLRPISNVTAADGDVFDRDRKGDRDHENR